MRILESGLLTRNRTNNRENWKERVTSFFIDRVSAQQKTNISDWFLRSIIVKGIELMKTLFLLALSIVFFFYPEDSVITDL